MIKVLIVDDSKLIRKVLAEFINATPDLTVCGEAADPYEARELIKQLHPDVISLDVEMPRMDGITFLKNLMRLHPLPVIMISTLTEKNASVTMEALSIGAIDFVTKPKVNQATEMDLIKEEIVAKLRAAANVSKSMLRNKLSKRDIDLSKKSTARSDKNNKLNKCLIAMGASTGGTEAISYILNQLPAVTPPIVITQHIPPMFSQTFAARLDRECLLNVCEAKNSQILMPSHVYVAPGDKHLTVKKQGGFNITQLNDDEKVSGHKPSVDVLFDSIQLLDNRDNILCLLLTGMGTDGANAMKALRGLNIHTIAQDQNSSVVWGMPGTAVQLGAVSEVLSLSNIPTAITNYFGGLE